MRSFSKNYKTDKLYVNRDEVAGNLRGTTRIEAVARQDSFCKGCAGAAFHLVCSLTGTIRYCLLLPFGEGFNSQLWGELLQMGARKGLQPVALSLWAFLI
jgi:hypothetical protein